MSDFIGPDALRELCVRVSKEYIVRLDGSPDSGYSSRLGRNMDARDRASHIREDAPDRLLSMRKLFESGILKALPPKVTRTPVGDSFMFKSRYVTPCMVLSVPGGKPMDVKSRQSLDVRNDAGELQVPSVLSGVDDSLEVKREELQILVGAALAGLDDKVASLVHQVHEHWEDVGRRTPEIAEEFARRRASSEGKAFRAKLKKALAAHDGILEQPPEHILWALRQGADVLLALSKFVHRNPTDVHIATDDEIKHVLDELRAGSVVES